MAGKYIKHHLMAIYGYDLDTVKSPLGRLLFLYIGQIGILNQDCKRRSLAEFPVLALQAGTPRDQAPSKQEVWCFGGGMEKVS